MSILMKTNNYKLLFHEIFYNRVRAIVQAVEKLYSKLPFEEYKKHELTKLLARITRAYKDIIPDNPTQPDYYLKGSLAKYRRYKRGLQRYRLMFCFSNNPAIIVYLYLNDENHLRKEGSKTDPYREFATLVKKGVFSSSPTDPKLRKWMRNELA